MSDLQSGDFQSYIIMHPAPSQHRTPENLACPFVYTIGFSPNTVARVASDYPLKPGQHTGVWDAREWHRTQSQSGWLGIRSTSPVLSSHTRSDPRWDQFFGHLKQQLCPAEWNRLRQWQGVCQHPADRSLGPGVEPDGPGRRRGDAIDHVHHPHDGLGDQLLPRG